MADISKEQQDAILFIEFLEAAFKLGRNSGMEEARKLDWVEVMREGSLVTWGDAGTLGYRIVEKLESLKDNTP